MIQDKKLLKSHPQMYSLKVCQGFSMRTIKVYIHNKGLTQGFKFAILL